MKEKKVLFHNGDKGHLMKKYQNDDERLWKIRYKVIKEYIDFELRKDDYLHNNQKWYDWW